MSCCCVPGCGSNSKKNIGLHFFNFPKIRKTGKLKEISQKRHELWRRAIKLSTNRSSVRVCAKHFKSGKSVKTSEFHHPDWVPTVNLPKEVSALSDRRIVESRSKNTNKIEMVLLDSCEETEYVQENEPMYDDDDDNTTDSDDEKASFENKYDDEFIEEVINLNQESPEQKKKTSRKAISCCVPKCPNVRNSKKSKIKFYRFPSKGIRLTAWINAVHRIDITAANAVHKIICSQHFQTGAPANDRKQIDWIPNQKMPKLLFTKSMDCSSVTDKNADEKRTEISVALSDEEMEIVDSDESKETNKKIADLAKQVQLLNSENNALNQQIMAKDMIIVAQNEEIRMHSDTQKLMAQKHLKKIDTIKATYLKMCITRESFENDDKKVNYFTGLNSLAVLDFIHDYVKDDLMNSMMKRANKFNILVMILMKLRLDLPLAYLGYRFGIGPNAMAQIFHANLKILNDKLGEFIRWPANDDITEDNTCLYYQRVLGNKFTCFLDFIEDPGPDCSKNSQTLKHFIKKKYLVAISPSGSIIYVSTAFNNSLSVKEIAEKCGILDNVNEGETILSDHGKQIHHVRLYNGSKTLVASPKSKVLDLLDSLLHDSETSDNDEETTQNQTNRTYVHKKLSSLKNKYFALINKHRHGLARSYKNNNTDDNNYFDYVVRICCALVNVTPEAVKVEANTS